MRRAGTLHRDQPGLRGRREGRSPRRPSSRSCSRRRPPLSLRAGAAGPDRRGLPGGRAAGQGEHGGILVAAGGDGTINCGGAGRLRARLPAGRDRAGHLQPVRARARPAAGCRRRPRACCWRAQPEPVQVGWVNQRLFLVNAVGRPLSEAAGGPRGRSSSKLGRRRWIAMLAALKSLLEWRRQLVLDVELDGAADAAAHARRSSWATTALQLRAHRHRARTSWRRSVKGGWPACVLQPIGTLGHAAAGAARRAGPAGRGASRCDSFTAALAHRRRRAARAG